MNSAECGYCRRLDESPSSPERFSYYARTSCMTPDFYQTLVDRGWRRSGSLLYRPNVKQSCCPPYTLRLDAAQFKPQRDQRQAINRFNKFILGEPYLQAAVHLHPLTREQKRARDSTFDLVGRVHEAEADMVKRPPAPAHYFSVTLEPNDFTEEKYAVFENYQRLVHQESPDDISRYGFKRFLCESPLVRIEAPAEPQRQSQPRHLGSFHQCYRIDGVLVAVAVLDLLPHAVSAVYFMYHESIQRHCPGKLGALREIALAMEGGYRWWYPGYYIHGCPKMRYKIDYSPQYVLDPETLVWHLMDQEVLALFDRYPYVSISRLRQAPDPGHAILPADRLMTDVTDKEEMGEDSHDEDDEEDEDEWLDFLLESSMPGITSLATMRQVNMDHLHLDLGFPVGNIYACQLPEWDSSDIDTKGSIKSRIAELVAAVGPDMMHHMCLDLRRKR